MAKREYLDDGKRSGLDAKFGKQDWMNPAAAPNITTNNFGKGWRWTYSKDNGWYLKNSKDIADVVRHNVINPVKDAVNSKYTKYVAAAAGTAIGGPALGAKAYAVADTAQKSKAADYLTQKFNESFDSDYVKGPNEPDYDLDRVVKRGAEVGIRNMAEIYGGAPAKKSLSKVPMLTEEPGQIGGQGGSARGPNTVNSVGYDPGKRDPFAARKYYKDVRVTGGDNRSGNPQTLFKPYAEGSGEAVVVTGSHLAPEAVSVVDRKTGKTIARATRPRSIANGNRANWDLGLPGHLINDAIIVFEGTGRTMYVKDGRGRWKTDKL